ncbi:hypothetical protein ACHAWO_003828 [Cyclotella atomus]|uniref:C3H1-type domain-containing protein n=1 Tax=Cyclotella atomus TaxID=382360 RepID=A0ABD3QSA7_9STRA
MDGPLIIPTTIGRYEATCTICSSSIHPGERIFCFAPPAAGTSDETPSNSIDISNTNKQAALAWAHKSCHHPILPPPPSCRHWTRLGRCPAFQADMCAFLHLPSDRGSSSILNKTRWGGKRHFTRNQHKNSAFRIFLMKTYGMEYLTRQHSTIVDVAGGKGELSWELLNLTGVHDCLVVDPRPLNLDLVRKKWSKGLYEPQRTGPVFSKWYPACEVGCKRRESRSPSHLRCFFQCREFIDFVDVDETEEGCCDSQSAWLTREIDRAKCIVWTTKGLQHEDGSDYNEMFDRAESDATNAVKSYSTEITDATIAKIKLRNCHLLIGLHPDQAAGEIVDYAISKNIPYCIVPCCVYSQLFTKRKLKDGTVVTTSDQLIDWLCEKDERAKVATLDLEGKNKVVYTLP